MVHAAFAMKELGDLLALLRYPYPHDGLEGTLLFRGPLLDMVLRQVNPFARIPLCGMISQYNLDPPDPGPRSTIATSTGRRCGRSRRRRPSRRGSRVLQEYRPEGHQRVCLFGLATPEVYPAGVVGDPRRERDRVAERLGDGSYVDLVRYDLLASEYAAR